MNRFLIIDITTGIGSSGIVSHRFFTLFHQPSHQPNTGHSMIIRGLIMMCRTVLLYLLPGLWNTRFGDLHAYSALVLELQLVTTPIRLQYDCARHTACLVLLPYRGKHWQIQLFEWEKTLPRMAIQNYRWIISLDLQIKSSYITLRDHP